jgi:two-component system, LytTR family, sensor kinase
LNILERGAGFPVPLFYFENYHIDKAWRRGRRMFSHRYSPWFAGILGFYSFLNIFFLDGDRLFAVAIAALPLFILILILSFSVWYINRLIQHAISKSKSRIHPLILQFVVSVILVLVLAYFSSQVTGLILGGPFNVSWQNFLLTSAFVTRINLFLNSVNAIYYFNSKLEEKAIEAEKLKTLTTEARLKSVNSQLNPHFFFNNLSTLSALIHLDNEAADSYLQKLSEIYRYILKNKNNELISVSEEIDFLKKYMDMLTIRFEESLKFSLDLEKSSFQKLIPPAVLQLLLENVVKHNYFTRKEPLAVVLSSDGVSLKIFNKKQPKEVVEFSSGIGLQNISDRYRFLNFDIRIEDDPEYFMVELPLIDDQTLTSSRG